MNLDKQYR